MGSIWVVRYTVALVIKFYIGTCTIFVSNNNPS